MGYSNEIFDNKNLSDLFKDLYTSSKKRDKQITTLIGELKPLVNDLSDATVIVPLIKDYLEVGIKNDDILVKVATIVQRLETGKSTGGDDMFIDPEELQSLLQESNSIDKNIETATSSSISGEKNDAL